jgi:hypothetical protein
MNELLPYLSSYGLPGLLLAGGGWLLCRLIERGFTFHVPPKEE